jgi:hypothetical protein
MGYVRNEFGTLSNVKKDNSFVWITNTNGDRRKMSLSKYRESAEAVYSKAQTLVGKEVSILTSQNTSDWSTSEWFSDIFEK